MEYIYVVFPQALTINGFTGAVMGATLGPAIVGEFLRHTVAANESLLGAAFADYDAGVAHIPMEQLYGMVRQQALVVSMKEIYGWLLIVALISLTVILVSYGPIRPLAIFPKWKKIHKIFRREAKLRLRYDVE